MDENTIKSLYDECLLAYTATNWTSFNASATVDTEYVIDPKTGSTNSSESYRPSARGAVDSCEYLFALLLQPTHDARRYARELLTYLVMGVAGTTVGCFGLLGNLLSLIVLTRRTMRTSTYCYLAALAVCDLLVVACMLVLLGKDTRRPERLRPPLPTADDAGYYPYVFPYLHPVAFTLQVSSVWLTLAFTVDRYIMICHPFRSEPFCTVRRARRVVVSLIVASIAFNLPKFFEYRTVITPGVPTHRLAGWPILPVAGGSFDVTNDSTGSTNMGEIIPSVVTSDLTDLGRSKTFKVLYHSWFYILFVFGLPFGALVVLNGFLASAVHKSRQRCRELVRPTKCSPLNHKRQPARPATDASICLLGIATASELPSSRPASSSIPAPAPHFNNDQQQQQPRQQQQQQQHQQQQSHPSAAAVASPVAKRIDTTVMLISVVVIFIVCQLPALVSRILWAFEDLTQTGFTELPMYALNEVANFLVLLNSSVNIVPYYFFGRRFRRQFLSLFCPRCSSASLTSGGAGPSGIDGGNNSPVSATASRGRRTRLPRRSLPKFLGGGVGPTHRLDVLTTEQLATVGSGGVSENLWPDRPTGQNHSDVVNKR